MLDLRLSVSEGLEDVFWYVHLIDLPFFQYLDSLVSEMPCDLEELAKSCVEDGVYCLFKCICRDAACSSVWVEVRHEKGEVFWGQAYRNNEIGEIGALLGNVKWSFNEVGYRSTISKAEQLSEMVRPVINV